MSSEECTENVCVPYVPTPIEDAMQALAKCNPIAGETLLDLGCADAAILKEAHKRFGLRGIGIELDQERYLKAKANVEGLPITIYQKSIVASAPQITKSRYVWCYLLQSVNNDVVKQLLEQYLKPNARVISRHYTLEGWTPSFEWNNIYFYFSHPSSNQSQMQTANTREDYVKQIKDKYEKILLAREGVNSVAVGETDKGLGLIVSVESDKAIVPIQLEGVPVKREGIGIIEAIGVRTVGEKAYEVARLGTTHASPLKITAYEFGKITIDSTVYDRDVALYNEHVEHWKRKDWHKAWILDVKEVVEKAKPKVVIIGCGASNMLKIQPEAERWLREKGIELVAKDSYKAVEEYNKRVEAGEKVVSFFHVTC